MATKFETERAATMQAVKETLENMGHEVLQTATYEIAIPIVNAEGDESYIVIPFKIPKGSRDGDAYDGHALAQEYELKQWDKAQKARERAKAKAAKIERDKKAREEKARLKAEQAN